MSLQKGCVLHAPLDQESYNPSTLRFTDKSAFGNHGIGANAAAFTTDRMGQVNRAMTFNGTTDVINCGNDDSLNTTNAMGIYVRIKPSALAGQNVIVSKWLTAGQYSYIFDFSATYPRLIMSSNGTTAAALVQTDNEINIDQWYDIVMVYNGTAQTVDFYIDGSIVTSSVTSGTIPASIHQSTDQVNIGQTTGGNLHGDIAETRIYNRVLTESEITYLYESYRPKLMVGP